MEESKIIGKNIRLLRKEKGLTQEQLGEVVCLKQDSISLWELGKVSPNATDIIKLAKFFDVSADYILGLD